MNLESAFFTCPDDTGGAHSFPLDEVALVHVLKRDQATVRLRCGPVFAIKEERYLRALLAALTLYHAQGGMDQATEQKLEEKIAWAFPKTKVVGIEHNE